jgi:hypothetical protein
MRYKICGLETHSKSDTNTSAVDWWRVVNPLSHLNPEKFDVTIKKKIIDEKDIIGSWRKLGKTTIFYIPRTLILQKHIHI